MVTREENELFLSLHKKPKLDQELDLPPTKKIRKQVVLISYMMAKQFCFDNNFDNQGSNISNTSNKFRKNRKSKSKSKIEIEIEIEIKIEIRNQNRNSKSKSKFEIEIEI